MRVFAYVMLVVIAASAALRAAPVAGVLTDLNGKPLGGVRVYSFLIGGTEGQPCTPKTETSVVTGADGRYSLGDLPSLTANQYRYLVAYLPGKHIGWTMQSPGMAEMERFFGKPRQLMAAPAVKRTGHVVDESGRPMAGVAVKYLGLRIEQGYPMFLPDNILTILGIPTDLTTGNDGAYTITDAAADADVLVTPRKNGFAARNTCIDPAELKIVLVPAGRIEGQVKDADGKPLQGVGVAAFQNECSNQTATTDTHGHFVLKDLSPGKWKVAAHYQGRSFATPRDATVKASETTHLPAISAMATAVVSGKVVYADTGRPAEGVEVGFVPEGVETWTTGNSESTTDASGAFKADAPVGKNILTVHQLPTGYLTEQPFHSVVVPKTGLQGQEIRLVKAAVGSGRVTNETGQPVAGAVVSFFMRGGASAPTGADGRFSLTMPRPSQREDYFPFSGSAFATSAEQQHRNLGAVKVVSRDDLLEGKVTVVVKPMASVKVRVLLPSGKPAAGAEVSKVATIASESGSSSSSGLPGTHTDAGGMAKVDNLMPGVQYDIVASLPGYFDAAKRPAILPDTEVPDVITINLEPATRVQKGKVIDEKGKPVAGAEVRAEGRGLQTIASTTTDAAGHFTLRGLPDSSVRISGDKDGRYGSMVVNKSSGAIVLQISPQAF